MAIFSNGCFLSCSWAHHGCSGSKILQDIWGEITNFIIAVKYFFIYRSLLVSGNVKMTKTPSNLVKNTILARQCQNGPRWRQTLKSGELRPQDPFFLQVYASYERKTLHSILTSGTPIGWLWDLSYVQCVHLFLPVA